MSVVLLSTGLVSLERNDDPTTSPGRQKENFATPFLPTSSSGFSSCTLTGDGAAKVNDLFDSFKSLTNDGKETVGLAALAVAVAEFEFVKPFKNEFDEEAEDVTAVILGSVL